MPESSNYNNNNSCIVMLSGGFKSLACYLYAKKKYKKVYPLIICYHQVNSSEIRHAISWVKALRDSPSIARLPHFSDYHGKVPFIAGRGPQPLTKDALDSIEVGEERPALPGLQMSLLSVAASYASVLGVQEVLTGYWAGESEEQKQDFNDFIKSAEVCINSGISLSCKISYLSPLSTMSLKELKEFCKTYKSRLVESHSCIHEIDGGCQKCKKCLTRYSVLS
jgi:7-cyano-7-deazaguanine synthase